MYNNVLKVDLSESYGRDIVSLSHDLFEIASVLSQHGYMLRIKKSKEKELVVVSPLKARSGRDPVSPAPEN